MLSPRRSGGAHGYCRRAGDLLEARDVYPRRDPADPYTVSLSTIQTVATGPPIMTAQQSCPPWRRALACRLARHVDRGDASVSDVEPFICGFDLAERCGRAGISERQGIRATGARRAGRGAKLIALEAAQ